MAGQQLSGDGARRLVYAGIGSRETPPEVLDIMTRLAAAMESLGYGLRSGGAKGADAAFELGVSDPRNRTIYLPGDYFNGRRAGSGGYVNSQRLPGWPQALQTVNEYHGAPYLLKDYARNLMARNAMQVLGPNLDAPAARVVAWAPGGYEGVGPVDPMARRGEGGTGQALRIARAYGVPIRNLANESTLQKAVEWLERIGQ